MISAKHKIVPNATVNHVNQTIEDLQHERKHIMEKLPPNRLTQAPKVKGKVNLKTLFNRAIDLTLQTTNRVKLANIFLSGFERKIHI